MVTFPSTIISAGHPISRMHFLHWMHLSEIFIFSAGLLMAMQGDWNKIAFTPGSAAHSLTARTALARSKGSTTSIFLTPIPSRTLTMLTLSTAFPIMLRPVPGCGWCPVMAVVELSSTHKIMSASLQMALTTPVMPEAKKVESPTKAKQTPSGSVQWNPCAMVMPAPMHRQVSTMSSGMAFPRV